MSRMRVASLSTADGFVFICMSRVRKPLAIAAFSA
jgi:hypothetical protein